MHHIFSNEDTSFKVMRLSQVDRAMKLWCRKSPEGFEKALPSDMPGHVAQSVGHRTRKSGVLGSIPGLATYFCFSFLRFKRGSCQLLAKVYAQSTG